MTLNSSYDDLTLSPGAERCGQSIRERQGTTGMRPASLQERLAKRTGLSALDVARALLELSRLELITGIDRNGRPFGMVRWIGPVPAVLTTPDELEWSEILASLGVLDARDRDALAVPPVAMKGLDRDDKVALLEGMLAMRQSPCSTDVWVWSAENLLGSSKAARSLRCELGILGVNLDDSGGQYYVITAGPAEPDAVVLIENPRVFAAVATSKHCSHILAVATYGYGLTIGALGERLLKGQVVACPAFGDRVDLARAVGHRPTYFWGDLDLEGLRIYESLKQRLPSIRLSAAYGAMDRALDDRRRSHPYHRLFEKDGQRIPPSGHEADVAYLAGRCSQRAVDQEAVVRIVDQVDLTMPFNRE